ALEYYLGLVDRDPEPIPFDAARAQEIVGKYANEVMTLTIDTVGATLRMEGLMKPEIRAAANKELPPDYPPFDFGLLPGGKDESFVTTGGLKGQRGSFTRAAHGVVVGVDLAGRLFTRVPRTAS